MLVLDMVRHVSGVARCQLLPDNALVQDPHPNLSATDEDGALAVVRQDLDPVFVVEDGRCLSPAQPLLTHELRDGLGAAATTPRSEVPIGQTLAGTPSKKARSPTSFERSSIRSARCSRTQVAATGAAASALAWVSHRLIERQVPPPVSASP